MKAVIGNKHQAILKIVKKLDQELMIAPQPDKFTESTQLHSMCINQLSKDLTLTNCISMLEFADTHIIDELKINCIKFIMLNIVSFFCEGTKLCEQFSTLPIYLVRDVSNFLKTKDIQKFLWVDMAYFE